MDRPAGVEHGNKGVNSGGTVRLCNNLAYFNEPPRTEPSPDAIRHLRYVMREAFVRKHKEGYLPNMRLFYGTDGVAVTVPSWMVSHISEAYGFLKVDDSTHSFIIGGYSSRIIKMAVEFLHTGEINCDDMSDVGLTVECLENLGVNYQDNSLSIHRYSCEIKEEFEENIDADVHEANLIIEAETDKLMHLWIPTVESIEMQHKGRDRTASYVQKWKVPDPKDPFNKSLLFNSIVEAGNRLTKIRMSDVQKQLLPKVYEAGVKEREERLERKRKYKMPKLNIIDLTGENDGETFKRPLPESQKKRYRVLAEGQLSFMEKEDILKLMASGRAVLKDAITLGSSNPSGPYRVALNSQVVAPITDPVDLVDNGNQTTDSEQLASTQPTTFDHVGQEPDDQNSKNFDSSVIPIQVNGYGGIPTAVVIPSQPGAINGEPSGVEQVVAPIATNGNYNGHPGENSEMDIDQSLDLLGTGNVFHTSDLIEFQDYMVTENVPQFPNGEVPLIPPAIVSPPPALPAPLTLNGIGSPRDMGAPSNVVDIIAVGQQAPAFTIPPSTLNKTGITMMGRPLGSQAGQKPSPVKKDGKKPAKDLNSGTPRNVTVNVKKLPNSSNAKTTAPTSLPVNINREKKLHVQNNITNNQKQFSAASTHRTFIPEMRVNRFLPIKGTSTSTATAQDNQVPSTSAALRSNLLNERHRSLPLGSSNLNNPGNQRGPHFNGRGNRFQNHQIIVVGSRKKPVPDGVKVDKYVEDLSDGEEEDEIEVMRENRGEGAPAPEPPNRSGDGGSGNGDGSGRGKTTHKGT